MVDNKIPELIEFEVGTKILSAEVNSNFDSVKTSTNYALDNTIFAEKYNGGALNDITINAAISAIGADEATLYLKTGTWEVSNDIIFPGNIKVNFPKAQYYQTRLTL